MSTDETSAPKKGAAAELPQLDTFNVEWWTIDRPVPYPRNPRKISEKAIDKTARSLKRFGWRQPIVVDEESVIIVGHTRLLAARKLGMTHVPVHVAIGMSEEEAQAYRIADNRTGEESEWDSELLAPELEEIQAFDADLLEDTGFDEKELAQLLGEPGDDDEPGEPMPDQWICAVTCKNEFELQRIFDELTARGLECKLIT